ncbi:MAG TPA: hypothetical protein DEF68_09500 [Elusimicrobia bacterium]|nr:hypothetical protein [Elusimicrobiota bacterium]
MAFPAGTAVACSPAAGRQRTGPAASTGSAYSGQTARVTQTAHIHAAAGLHYHVIYYPYVNRI